MQPPPFLRFTAEERRALKRRIGPREFDARLKAEATREARLGGLVRLCPMRAIKPLASAAFWCCGLYGRGRRESLDIRVSEERFAVKGLPRGLDGFTLLHMSDLHIDVSPGMAPAIAKALRAAAGTYDAAVVTGDFNNFTVHNEGAALKLLAGIFGEFTAPVYGVLGNHDSLRDVPELERIGVRMLLNEGVALRRAPGGPVLHLAGVDDPNIFRTHDLSGALRARPDGAPCVLLAHAPSLVKEAAAAGVDLMLCGHIHGGQICLPGGKTLPWRNWKFPRRFWKGRWTEGALQGYTSRGAGSCGVPLRFNCPPEITRITLAVAG